jgi:hypothetical protein
MPGVPWGPQWYNAQRRRARGGRKTNVSPAHAPIALRLEVLESRRMLTTPSVVSIDRLSPSEQYSSASIFTYAVTFSESVLGVSSTDFRVTTSGGVAVDQAVSVSGSGAAYTVTVAGVHGSGALRLDLVDADTIQNGSGELLGGPGAANGSFHGQSYEIDQAAPFVQSITRSDPLGPSTGASTVVFTVTFNEPVIGVDRTDFVAVTTGSVTASSYLGMVGGGAVYLVSVDNVTGTGTLRLDLADNRTIRDTSGNELISTNAPINYAGPIAHLADLVPISATLGDLNGDQEPDMVIANFLAQTLSIRLGTGDGNFGAVSQIPTGSNPQSVAIEDLNGDGKNDLAIANFNTNTVGVMLGNGNGTFGGQTTYITGTNPQSVIAADLDRDGAADLIVTNAGENSVGVFLGNGDGTFQNQVTYLTGPNPHTVAVVDLNTDGTWDLVTANFGNDTAGVLLGNGNGTFGGASFYNAGGDPQCIATGDFNGDDVPDVAIANPGNNVVSVLLGIAGGGLGARVEFGTGLNPQCVVSADVNLDGKPDLVVVNYDEGSVGILRGNGDGTFSVQTSFATGSGPQSVAIADLNGDGLQDFAVANFQDGTASVILSELNADFTGQTYTIQAATHLDFATPPGPTLAGAPLAAPTGVRVSALDENDNVVADSDSTVKLTLIGGTFVNGATTAFAPVLGGIATFGNLIINAPGNYSLQASVDALGGASSPVFTVSPAATVVNRRLFYKGSSKFNITNNNLPGYSDDNAIAPDKTAYLPGTGTSNFANASSYVQGINGVMIDLTGPHGVLAVNDFVFKTGNNNSPQLWATAVTPTLISVRSGAGVGGSDRIELIWDDSTITKKWLQIQLRGNDALGGWNLNSGLASTDVFYFANPIGDSSAVDVNAYLVSSADQISARNDPHGPGNPAPISNLNDHNRDGLVNSSDQIIVLNNTTTVGTQVIYLNVNVPPTADAGGPYLIGSNQQLALHGSGTDLDLSAVLTYSWDINGDNVFGDATGANPILSPIDLSMLGLAGIHTVNNVRVRVSDGAGTTTSAPTSLRIVAPSAIVGRHLFYLRSPKWNVTNNNLPGFSDDNAIAPDKTAYLPASGTSTFANVSSYTRGINGIMVDIAGRHGLITANDFIFKVGNNNSPASWGTVAGPTSVLVRAGAGANGSDRVELLWADGAISNTWLEVIARGNDSIGGFNSNTLLASSDVFFFGSAPADSSFGNTTGYLVSSTDEIAARNNPHGLGNPAQITDLTDFNRDGLVNSADQVAPRTYHTSIGTQLKFLVIGPGGPFSPETPTTGSEVARPPDHEETAHNALVFGLMAPLPPAPDESAGFISGWVLAGPEQPSATGPARAEIFAELGRRDAVASAKRPVEGGTWTSWDVDEDDSYPDGDEPQET